MRDCVLRIAFRNRNENDAGMGGVKPLDGARENEATVATVATYLPYVLFDGTRGPVPTKYF
jgi:hypothetical protein